MPHPHVNNQPHPSSRTWAAPVPCWQSAYYWHWSGAAPTWFKTQSSLGPGADNQLIVSMGTWATHSLELGQGKPVNVLGKGELTGSTGSVGSKPEPQVGL